MARSISLIQQQLKDQKNLYPELSGLNSPSQTAIWNLWLYIQAVAINLFEQLQDAFKVEMEQIASSAIPNTDAWIQKQAFYWQYNATNIQVIQLINYVPQYPTIIVDYRIITRCSVITDNNKNVKIKVAKSENPPLPLTTNELTSLTAYYKSIGNAGITYEIISANSDRIEIVADLYIDGQYQTTIQNTTITALKTYLANLTFDGIVFVSKIEDTLQAITGVKDVKIKQVNARRDSVSYSQTTPIYNLSSGINARQWQTYAGYIQEENTSGHDFTTTINYIIS